MHSSPPRKMGSHVCYASNTAIPPLCLQVALLFECGLLQVFSTCYDSEKHNVIGDKEY